MKRTLKNYSLSWMNTRTESGLESGRTCLWFRMSVNWYFLDYSFLQCPECWLGVVVTFIKGTLVLMALFGRNCSLSTKPKDLVLCQILTLISL